MVRIASSSMGRGLALVLLIGLGILTPLEALAEEDQAGRSRQTSPAEGRTQSRRLKNRSRSSR